MIGVSTVLGARFAFLDRWQLTPLYAAVVAATLGWWFTAFALTASSLLATLLVPLPDPRGLPGPHPIGVVDFEATLPSATQPAFGRLLYPAATPHTDVSFYMALQRHYTASLSRAFTAIASPPFLRHACTGR